jgi:hypothetical protein
MNFGLIELIKLLLTYSEETSAVVELKKDGTITKLSFDDTLDNISISNAKQSLTTRSGVSFFMMHFNGTEYKIKTYKECVDSVDIHFLNQLVCKVDIEKCQTKKLNE